MSVRLSSLDAAFLELEDSQEAAHMHIGAVLVFEAGPEGPPELARLRRRSTAASTYCRATARA